MKSLNIFTKSFLNASSKVSYSSILKRSFHNRKKDAVLSLYNKRVESGILRNDPNQLQTIQELNKIGNLAFNMPSKNHSQSSPQSSSTFDRILNPFSWGAPAAEPVVTSESTAVTGLYLWGGVGTGKTMLMDIFVDALGLSRVYSRTHFNTFMLDIQKRIHNFRLEGKHHNKENMMEIIVKDLVQNSSVLCFDEFQVLHIADAMLLQRLFSLLWKNNVIVIATSNRPPEDLYKGGLQRQLFLPFIALLNKHCKVIHLKSETDYRMTGNKMVHVFQVLSTAEARKSAIDAIWEELTEKREGEPEMLNLFGRKLYVPTQVKGIARFSFNDLCDNPLGAEDYAKLATTYHTIIIDNIPQMDVSQANLARRFITLVDELYNHRVKLICSSANEPGNLFPTAIDSWKNNNNNGINNKTETIIDCTTTLKMGDEEIFAFNRVVSRLNEMQTQNYLESKHITQ